MITKKQIKNILYPIISIVVFIGIWFIAALITGREFILPSPFSAIKSFLELIITAEFWQSIFSTLFRSLISFSISFVFAIIFAILSGTNKAIKNLLSPIITILRATPTISIILISLIWLKSTTAPMLIAFLIVFPTMYAAVYGAIITIDNDLIQMSKIYKVNNFDMIRKLYIPSVLPATFTSAKSNISLNLKIIIASEVLASTLNSIGYQMQLSKLYLQTPLLLAWTIAAVLLSFLLEIIVEIIKRKVIRWKV